MPGPRPLNPCRTPIIATDKYSSQMSKPSLGWHYFPESLN